MSIEKPARKLSDIFRRARAVFSNAGKNSRVTVHLYRNESGKASGWQIETSDKEMTEIIDD